ncbi:glycosyltransferase [Lentibacillus sp. Marseille-P4043]|uniref:glycosyltransferase n=1 Tax=Lentibacillus sp. Marseille-P4043 TaxID=2040293 RepID=UPI000D0BB2A3|nr:glycosyltransferase [Lentibacillus sp. Marseille-P4043]
MDKPTIYFLMNSLEIERGGLTKASLKQASMFAELGYEVQMLSFNFNAFYPYIRQQLVELGKVHENVVIRNMYEELEGQSEPLYFNGKLKPANLEKLAGNSALSKRKGHNAYRVFENGCYTKYISLASGDALKFIDYFNENRYRIRREQFDPWGKPKQLTYMDFLTNKPRQSIYFDKKGRAYLAAWYNQEKDKYDRVYCFSKNGEIVKEYTGDILKLKIDWLAEVIKHDENPVIVSDTRSTDAVITGLKEERAVKIWRLHSHHVAHPYEDDSPIAGKVKHGIANLDKFDGIFLLTEQQKRDISEKYGYGEKMYVVPHYHEPVLEQQIGKDEKLAVVISRLSTLKRVDHIIKAFKKVVDKVPDARLVIYGKGTETDKLKVLIQDLGLGENVSMQGYTNEPDTVYANALFSVLASKSEGFSLSILESMTNGTPVISYDIKYGPNDLIENGQNGFIVEKANIDALAEKMIDMFTHPKEAIKMGEDAKQHIDNHYNKTVYIDKWEKYIQELIE